MMSQKEEIEVLMSLGLTKSQAKVYSVLVGSDILPVKYIFKKANLAREQVYQILLKLFELGIVEKIIDHPNKYRAIPYEDCLAILMEEKKKKTIELEKKVAQICNNFEKNISQSLPCFDPQFILIPQKKKLEKTYLNFISNCKKLDIITVWTRASKVFFEYYDLIQASLENGSTFRFIIGNDLEKNKTLVEKLKQYPNFQIKDINLPIKTIFALKDNSELLITCNLSEDINQNTALYSINSSLVDLAKCYFEELWKK